MAVTSRPSPQHLPYLYTGVTFAIQELFYMGSLKFLMFCFDVSGLPFS